MPAPQTSNAIRFWKIYGILVAVDLLLYVLIFYVGRAIPPASPYTSNPGNYGLCLGWLFAHFPACLVFFSAPNLPDTWMWLLTVQDAWLAGLLFLWRRNRLNKHLQAAPR